MGPSDAVVELARGADLLILEATLENAATDDARRGHRRALESCGLQRIAGGEQPAEQQSRDRTVAAERAHAPSARHGEHGERDREPHREERKERIELERVLDLHEGDPPDRRDEDQDGDGKHARTLPPARHRGARLVFDMHEVFPEFTAAKFPGASGGLQ